jgi:hypothetical protein
MEEILSTSVIRCTERYCSCGISGSQVVAAGYRRVDPQRSLFVSSGTQRRQEAVQRNVQPAMQMREDRFRKKKLKEKVSPAVSFSSYPNGLFFACTPCCYLSCFSPKVCTTAGILTENTEASNLINA